MIQPIPDAGGGGGAPSGAAGGGLAGTYPNPTIAGVTAANVVPFRSASSGILTQDQYFTYTAIPATPVAVDAFGRLVFTDAGSPSGWVLPYSESDILINRTITALNTTDNGQAVGGVISNIVASPATDWRASGIELSGMLSAILIPFTATNAPTAVFGVQSKLEYEASEVIDDIRGLKVTANHNGAANAGGVFGLSAEVSVGGTSATSLYGGYFDTNTVADIATEQIGIRNGVTVQGGTVGTVYALRNTGFIGGGGAATNKWDISAETTWPSRLLGKVAIGESNSAVPTSTLYVKDATASTGATSVTIDIGAGQSNTSNVLTIGGVLKFSGQNTTGAGTALLGTNSPAITNSAPYTWIRVISSDDSVCYLPAWK